MMHHKQVGEEKSKTLLNDKYFEVLDDQLVSMPSLAQAFSRKRDHPDIVVEKEQAGLFRKLTRRLSKELVQEEDEGEEDEQKETITYQRSEFVKKF